MFIQEGLLAISTNDRREISTSAYLNFSKLTTWELTEGAAVLSSEFISLQCKEAKKCVSLESINNFASISAFWILVRIFKNT